MLKFIETTVPARDGILLFMRNATPAGLIVPEAAPLLVILHGACEHGGRYQHVAAEAVLRGWRVCLPDLRGHGRSGGVRVHVSRFDEYLSDLTTIIQSASRGPAPVFLLANSTGGMIAAVAAGESPGLFDGLVLTSPFFELAVPVPGPLKLAGKIASIVAPRTRFKSRVKPEEVCHDPAMMAARQADPLIQRSITARWFSQIHAGIRRAWASVGRVTCPVLLCQAGDDRVVKASASREWFQQLRTADKTYHEFPGQFHEILHEPERAVTLALIFDWLDVRRAASSQPGTK